MAQIIQSHYRLLYGIAYGYFRNSSQAEDMVQNAAVKALQNLETLRKPERVVEWLARITRNTCIDGLRQNKDGLMDPVEVLEHIPAPGSLDVHRLERQRMLLSEINALPENLAIAIRLRFLEDCNIGEIAGLLGIRRNTVEVRLHRALKKLAKSKSLKIFQRESR